MKSRLPKVLHRVCGKEMVSLVAETARKAGFEQATVVIAPEHQAVRDSLGASVTYAVQSEQRGTGHALLQARAATNGADHLALMYGDVPLIRAETLRGLMELHTDSRAAVTVLTALVPDPHGLGRIVRNDAGGITRIVEEADADEKTKAVREINTGLYCFDAAWMWPVLEALKPSRSGEIYLTDLIEEACRQRRIVASMAAADVQEVQGVNTRVQLAEAEAALGKRIRERWMLAGVTMIDPASVYIDFDIEIGADTIIHPNTHIRGKTKIGSDCEIGPNSIIENATIGDRCKIKASAMENSTMESDSDLGPFGHVRPGSHIESHVHLGNYAEVSRSRIGSGTKMGHMSFMGDARVGKNVNIGAGTITTNYDGIRKHITIIEDDVKLGCDTMLVAPVTLGARSMTGAGAVVTKDVGPYTVAVGLPAKPFPKRTTPKECPEWCKH